MFGPALYNFTRRDRREPRSVFPFSEAGRSDDHGKSRPCPHCCLERIPMSGCELLWEYEKSSVQHDGLEGNRARTDHFGNRRINNRLRQWARV